MRNDKYIMQKINFFFLNLVMVLFSFSICADIEESSRIFPIKEADVSAEHLMICMFAYSEETASTVKYVATIMQSKYNREYNAEHNTGRFTKINN